MLSGKTVFEHRIMNKILKQTLVLSAAILIMASCSSKTSRNINYIQDISANSAMEMKVSESLIVQPKDMISIVVSSRTPELSAMFNLVNVTYQAGSEAVSGSGGSQRLLGYAVDVDGNIDFPILGELHVAGLNRWGVAALVKNELVERNLLKDPVVTVEFMNFKFSVIGEVSHPGSFAISGDRINLLEALALAGDLSIYGRRDNICVIREDGGRRTFNYVDIRNSDLFSSPVYYLRQNDVIYVEPNAVRAGQSTINENTFRSVSFWMSLSSFILSTATVILALVR